MFDIRKEEFAEDNYNYERHYPGINDVDSCMSSLISRQVSYEKEFQDSFSEEIRQQENFENALEQSISDYHGRRHDEEPVFWGDEGECWCDEYVPDYGPFDSLDEQYYDY